MNTNTLIPSDYIERLRKAVTHRAAAPLSSLLSRLAVVFSQRVHFHSRKLLLTLTHGTPDVKSREHFVTPRRKNNTDKARRMREARRSRKLPRLIESEMRRRIARPTSGESSYRRVWQLSRAWCVNIINTWKSVKIQDEYSRDGMLKVTESSFGRKKFIPLRQKVHILPIDVDVISNLRARNLRATRLSNVEVWDAEPTRVVC